MIAARRVAMGLSFPTAANIDGCMVECWVLWSKTLAASISYMGCLWYVRMLYGPGGNRTRFQGAQWPHARQLDSFLFLTRMHFLLFSLNGTHLFSHIGFLWPDKQTSPRLHFGHTKRVYLVLVYTHCFRLASVRNEHCAVCHWIFSLLQTDIAPTSVTTWHRGTSLPQCGWTYSHAKTIHYGNVRPANPKRMLGLDAQQNGEWQQLDSPRRPQPIISIGLARCGRSPPPANKKGCLT